MAADIINPCSARMIHTSIRLIKYFHKTVGFEIE